MTTAVRNGLVLEDDPLEQGGVRPKTYRFPGQPEVRPRTLGPRSIDHVPPLELAHLMRRCADSTGWNDTDNLFREALGVLGMQRLRDPTRRLLESILPLAQQV